MERSAGTLTGAGGVDLAWRRWVGAGPARGVLVVVHGACEHGGRYGTVVGAAVARGFAVLAPDVRGHGRSGGERALVDDLDAVLEDLGAMLDLARADHPGVPVVLLGHGMGGALAVLAARRYAVDALVLSAPMLSAPRPSPVDATALSRDRAVVRAFEEDPLVHHGPLPERTVETLGEAAAACVARAGELTAPVLVMHGYADRLADPEASRAWHQAAGSDDKVLVLWEGLFHEVFNEPAEDREDPLERLGRWLDEVAG